ncbi:kynurenine--oxoglutarate transaminase 1-like [Carettochelys insculpta]|uniref:kynurenine--oxoglutarate transaminase 1-like n=1 Tax=Carettochelys insculpta TaxID=44489 RepID=UPI003EB9DA1D
MAATYPCVNLGKGFPDLPPPDFVKEAFVKTVSGENFMLHQYTWAFGHPALVMILARFYGKLLGQELDPWIYVLVTVGAYQALFNCFQALVDEGDEHPSALVKGRLRRGWALVSPQVIIIEPYFDCYEAMVKMVGGTPVFIQLRPAFSREEMELIADLCAKHHVLCFSNEVQEWVMYDGNVHIRIGWLDSWA